MWNLRYNPDTDLFENVYALEPEAVQNQIDEWTKEYKSLSIKADELLSKINSMQALLDKRNEAVAAKQG